MADLSGGSTRDAPTLWVKILSISCSFWENLAKSYVGAPSWICHWILHFFLFVTSCQRSGKGNVFIHVYLSFFLQGRAMGTLCIRLNLSLAHVETCSTWKSLNGNLALNSSHMFKLSYHEPKYCLNFVTKNEF